MRRNTRRKNTIKGWGINIVTHTIREKKKITQTYIENMQKIRIRDTNFEEVKEAHCIVWFDTFMYLFIPFISYFSFFLFSFLHSSFPPFIKEKIKNEKQKLLLTPPFLNIQFFLSFWV